MAGVSNEKSGAKKTPLGLVSRGILELAAKGMRVSVRLLGAFIQENLKMLFYYDRNGWTPQPNSFKRALARMESRGYLIREVIDQEFRIQLTSLGQVRLEQYWISDLEIPERPNTWDGQWRMVLFDIPEERKALRSVFRRKLQQFGFKYLQKSAWIYPFPCEDVLTELAARLNLADCIHVAVVRSLSSDDLARRKFQLMTDDPDALAAPLPLADPTLGIASGAPETQLSPLSVRVAIDPLVEPELLPIEEVE